MGQTVPYYHWTKIEVIVNDNEIEYTVRSEIIGSKFDYVILCIYS